MATTPEPGAERPIADAGEPTREGRAPRTPPASAAFGGRALPVLAALVLLGVTLVLWVALRRQREADLARAADLALANATGQIGSRLRLLVLSLGRMARRQERPRPPARQAWEADAELYLRDLPSLHAIAWTDSSLSVRWIMPGAEIPAATDLRRATEGLRREALGAAHAGADTWASRARVSIGDEKGFLVVVPARRAGASIGFVVALVRARELVGLALAHVAIGYSLAVLDGGEELYRRGDAPKRETAEAPIAEAAVAAQGVSWRVRAWASGPVLARQRSFLPEAALIFGSALSVLVATATGLAQTARKRERQAHEARDGLELEMRGRARAEEARRESEEKFRGLVEGAPDAIVAVNAKGRIVLTNAQTEALFGYSREELVGEPLEMLVPERLRATHEGHRRTYAANPTTRPMGAGLELSSRRKDGTEFPAEISLSPVPTADGVVTIAVIRDVTERKRAERALAEQAEALARSNAELEQFAYVASHDLQEPLRMVSSFTQLLAKRYSGKLDADADDFIGFAVDGANRMQALIEDLLTYSRVGTRGRPFARVDCEAVLGRVLRMLRVRADETGAEVTHGPLPTVLADESQLGQVFQNLVSNAIKFRGEAPPRVHVSAERTEGEWTFSVRDNGIGVAPEHAQRIFVIFQRLHGRTDYPGTGIGLAVCKKIIERHGGRIWAESQPGRGATFRFTIPLQP